ncbi:MAG: InlB B-repeat-containing protein, partial [Firmicutes bacterium]|nr:InlB B-repeat-containing protein [Bacillota bacterium]
MKKRLIGGLLTALFCSFAVFGLGESIASAEEVTAEGLTERASFYTITYDANGGYNAPSKQAVIPGEAVTISSDKPGRDAYTFLGWSKNKAATAATYLPGDNITTSGDLRLYAVWEKAKSLGTISADKSVNLNCKITYSKVWYEFIAGTTGNYMVTATIKDGNAGNQYYDIYGGFSQMITAYNDTYLEMIDSGNIGGSYNEEKPLVMSLEKGKRYYLYVRASWNISEIQTLPITIKISPNVKTITYDANGGYSAPSKQAITPGGTITISGEKPGRDVYTFLGWSKNKTATTAAYLPGDSI